MRLKHLSLFSGIGGFDLAAEWAGWENVAHCEWNEFGQKVLKYYWPDADSHSDITKTDFRKYEGAVDIISGGFPCQPYSAAGKRLGTEDERHLWPEMLRAIREIKPSWVVGENVLGLVNWNEGLVFEDVQSDLEAEGYEVQPYILPAAGVGAPHRRDRVWFIAYSNHTGLQRSQVKGGVKTSRPKRKEQFAGCVRPRWKEFPIKPPVCGRNDGLPRELDGITFPKWRNESIKAYGNAIVPQVAYQIFKAINEYKTQSDE